MNKEDKCNSCFDMNAIYQIFELFKSEEIPITSSILEKTPPPLFKLLIPLPEPAEIEELQKNLVLHLQSWITREYVNSSGILELSQEEFSRYFMLDSILSDILIKTLIKSTGFTFEKQNSDPLPRVRIKHEYKRYYWITYRIKPKESEIVKELAEKYQIYLATEDVVINEGHITKLTINWNLNSLYQMYYKDYMDRKKAVTAAKDNMAALEKLEKFPDPICQLKGLRELKITRTKISNIPDSISQLKHLKHLDLSGNQISSLPSTIGLLRKLITLNISKNKLTSLPSEIGSLSSLEKLNFGFNKITDIPSSIGKLTNLIELMIGEHNSYSSIPEEIGQIISLKELYLGSSPKYYLPQTFNHRSDLLIFSGWMEFTRSIYASELMVPLTIAQICGLEPSYHFLTKAFWIEIHNSSIIGLGLGENLSKLTSIPDNIIQLVNLERLSITNSNIKTLPRTINLLKRLKYLNIEQTSIQSLPPTIIPLIQSGLKMSIPRSMSGVNIEGYSLKQKEALRKLEKILQYPLPLVNFQNPDIRSGYETDRNQEVIILKIPKRSDYYNNQYNPILIAIPDCISQFQELKELDISGHHIREISVETVSKLHHLQTLNLANNPLKELLQELNNLPNLKRIIYDEMVMESLQHPVNVSLLIPLIHGSLSVRALDLLLENICKNAYSELEAFLKTIQLADLTPDIGKFLIAMGLRNEESFEQEIRNQKDYSYQELLKFAFKEGLKEGEYLDGGFFQQLLNDLTCKYSNEEVQKMKAISNSLQFFHTLINENLNLLKNLGYGEYHPLEEIARKIMNLMKTGSHRINKQVGNILNAITQSNFTPHEWIQYYNLHDHETSFLNDPQEILEGIFQYSRSIGNCKICGDSHWKACCNYCNSWVGCGYWEFTYEKLERGVICFHCLHEKEIIEDFNVEDSIRITNELEELSQTSIELQKLHKAETDWEVKFTQICLDCGHECYNIGDIDSEGMNTVCCVCFGYDFYRGESENMCSLCIQSFTLKCERCYSVCTNITRERRECCFCSYLDRNDYCESCAKNACKKCHRKCTGKTSDELCCLCSAEIQFNKGEWSYLPFEDRDEFQNLFFSSKYCRSCLDRYSM